MVLYDFTVEGRFRFNIMMLFRQIKTNIINILTTAEAGRFQTLSYQRQGKAAIEFFGTKRMVEVYFDSGIFSKRSAAIQGPFEHAMNFNIELSVAEAAKGDLSVLLDQGSTPAERAIALNNFNEAAPLADESFDELFEIVWQILTDARNYSLGLDKGIVVDRWIENVQKNQALPDGEYVVLTGSMNLKCTAKEEVLGDPASIIGIDADTSLELYSEDGVKEPVQKTGVTQEFPS